MRTAAHLVQRLLRDGLLFASIMSTAPSSKSPHPPTTSSTPPAAALFSCSPTAPRSAPPSPLSSSPSLGSPAPVSSAGGLLPAGRKERLPVAGLRTGKRTSADLARACDFERARQDRTLFRKLGSRMQRARWTGGGVITHYYFATYLDSSASCTAMPVEPSARTLKVMAWFARGHNCVEENVPVGDRETVAPGLSERSHVPAPAPCTRGCPS